MKRKDNFTKFMTIDKKEWIEFRKSVANCNSLSKKGKNTMDSKVNGFSTFKGKRIKKKSHVSFDKAVDISLKKHKKIYEKLSKL